MKTRLLPLEELPLKTRGDDLKIKRADVEGTSSVGRLTAKVPHVSCGLFFSMAKSLSEKMSNISEWINKNKTDLRSASPKMWCSKVQQDRVRWCHFLEGGKGLFLNQNMKSSNQNSKLLDQQKVDLWWASQDKECVTLACQKLGTKVGYPTWRIIPSSKWLVSMVSKSPKDRVVPLPTGLNGL